VTKTKIYIWDSPILPPEVEWKVVFWQNYSTAQYYDGISIPQYIEDNDEKIKATFLAWVYELGETIVGSASIKEILKLEDGLSYWWMTPFSEKGNYAQSLQIIEVIKLIALENWLQTNAADEIKLCSGNAQLAESLRDYCNSLNIGFEWKRIEIPGIKIWSRLRQIVPGSFRALLWLAFYVVEKWPLRGIGVDDWKKSDARITFFSYLLNLTPRSLEGGIFESEYWANLPAEIRQKGIKTNWLHINTKNFQINSSRKATKLVTGFGTLSESSQVHTTIDSFLTLQVLAKTVIQWVNLRNRLLFVRKSVQHVKCGELNLWPFFREEFNSSSKSVRSLENLLYANLFKEAMSLLPKQQLGFYLYEQQPWEFALLNSWRNYEHGKIYGVQHTTVLFWDLRYFHDARSYINSNHLELPKPDFVLANGPVSLRTFTNAFYPVSELIEVEALRYLYLKVRDNQLNDVESVNLSGRRIVVLGDYLASNTRKQLQLISDAKKFLSGQLVIIYKPHPACKLRIDNFIELNLTIDNSALKDLLQINDIAFCSASTSAAIDAYYIGSHVLSLRDSKELNMSPLRGLPGVEYIGNEFDLVNYLQNEDSLNRAGFIKPEYFLLDLDLRRWMDLLGL